MIIYLFFVDYMRASTMIYTNHHIVALAGQLQLQLIIQSYL